MSLFGLIDYGESSTSSSESDDDTTTQDSFHNPHIDSVHKTQEKDEKFALPSPLLDPPSDASSTGELSTRTFQQTSVFYNPFKAEERKKLDVLEKHVQLSKYVPPPSSSKKRVCYKYQKGKCRFGDTCRFAHNAHIIKTDTNNQSMDNAKESTAVHVVEKGTICDPDEEEEAKKPKKRRVGVSDTLVPPKRAMRAYEQQKRNEKPWN